MEQYDVCKRAGVYFDQMLDERMTKLFRCTEVYHDDSDATLTAPSFTVSDVAVVREQLPTSREAWRDQMNRPVTNIAQAIALELHKTSRCAVVPPFVYLCTRSVKRVGTDGIVIDYRVACRVADTQQTPVMCETDGIKLVALIEQFMRHRINATFVQTMERQWCNTVPCVMHRIVVYSDDEGAYEEEWKKWVIPATGETVQNAPEHAGIQIVTGIEQRLRRVVSDLTLVPDYVVVYNLSVKYHHGANTQRPFNFIYITVCAEFQCQPLMDTESHDDNDAEEDAIRPLEETRETESTPTTGESHSGCPSENTTDSSSSVVPIAPIEIEWDRLHEAVVACFHKTIAAIDPMSIHGLLAKITHTEKPMSVLSKVFYAQPRTTPLHGTEVDMVAQSVDCISKRFASNVAACLNDPRVHYVLGVKQLHALEYTLARLGANYPFLFCVKFCLYPMRQVAPTSLPPMTSQCVNPKQTVIMQCHPPPDAKEQCFSLTDVHQQLADDARRLGYRVANSVRVRSLPGQSLAVRQESVDVSDTGAIDIVALYGQVRTRLIELLFNEHNTVQFDLFHCKRTKCLICTLCVHKCTDCISSPLQVSRSALTLALARQVTAFYAENFGVHDFTRWCDSDAGMALPAHERASVVYFRAGNVTPGDAWPFDGRIDLTQSVAMNTVLLTMAHAPLCVAFGLMLIYDVPRLSVECHLCLQFYHKVGSSSSSPGPSSETTTPLVVVDAPGKTIESDTVVAAAGDDDTVTPTTTTESGLYDWDHFPDAYTASMKEARRKNLLVDADYMNAQRIDYYIALAAHQMRKHSGDDTKSVILSFPVKDVDILPILVRSWRDREFQCSYTVPALSPSTVSKKQASFPVTISWGC